MNKPSRRRSAPGAAPTGHVQKTDPNSQIASKLKALYQPVENEPVPQLFIDLLDRLEEVEKAKSRR